MTLNRKRLRLALLALIALAGCDGLATGGGLHETTVLGGALTIAAPPGYCINPAASVTRGSAIVALMGRCTARGEVAPAVVSVTVGQAASAGVLVAGPDALARFLTSAQGRKVMARDGVASHVAVIETRIAGEALFVHLNDRSVGEYWRAILALRGRLVTVSASGTEAAPLTPAQGLTLVRDVVTVLDKRNPDKAPPAQQS
ncbi:cation transport ATPase [bacterium]|nr:cation transport ATPase [bacterium]